MKKLYFSLIIGFFALGTMPSYALTYVVDNLSDIDGGAAYVLGDGTNSLRKCIRLSNALATPDVINFNIPSAAPYIIPTLSALTISAPVFIDGFTQPGASAGNLLIEIRGGNGGIQIFRLIAGSNNSTIRGLVIYTNNTTNTGIYATASTGHTFIRNYFGINTAGTAVAGTSPLQYGIDLDGASTCTIGGILGVATRNVFGSTSNHAIRIRASSNGTVIRGNYIGTNAAGLASLTVNGGNGIDITTCNNQTIGGNTYTSRNIICGGTIGINAQICNTLTIKGNFVGLGVDGATTIANTSQGIRVQNNGTASSAVTIGGPILPERNVIGGNGAEGIQINNASGVTIQNNYIGFDSTGLVAKVNGNDGVEIANNSTTILIGGSTYTTRNVIGNSTGVGLKINNSTVSVIIKGNFIGLAANGITSAPNTSQGINIGTAIAVSIGGPLLPERNIIGSNGNDGIQVATITGLTIQNNYIGFDSTGLVARGNTGDGMELNTSSTVVIGGADYNLRNVIGNNTQVGLRISNSTVSVTIKCNFIGLAANGITSAPNTNQGINIGTAVAVTIGGSLVRERNIISSNGNDGIQVSNITGLTIQNNYIGFDSTGIIAKGNTGGDGMELNNSSTILIGGSTYNLRNVIGNNGQHGLRINNGTVSTVVKGNLVGVALNNGAAGNLAYGMEINNTANVTVGGTVLAERNVVSSNGQRGISLNTSNPLVIQNNYVGTDSTGMLDRGNNQRGISVANAASLTIGGTTYTARNVVSGNGEIGIAIDQAPGAILKGNFVGLAKDGTAALNNAQHGVLIQNSTNAVVGGITNPERNVVSSNLQRGFEITNSAGVTVFNNYVGVDSTGTLMRGNLQHGMMIVACNGVVVGGTTIAKRNIFANNGNDGLRVENSTSPIIQGNYSGVDVTGLLDMGNGYNGINVYGCSNALIGGSTYSARNISSGNTEDGIFLHDNCAGSIVRANFTGVGKDGTTILGNGNSGIRVWGNNTSNGIIIGGNLHAERNVTAANGATATNDSRDGIRMEGGAGAHVVKGNYCGTDSTGTLFTGYGNTWAGISINEVTGGTFGGTGADEGNIASNNGHEGIWLRNAVSNTIVGNFVGTDKSATIQMGNGEFGINIRYTSLNNIIGGSAAEQNIIAYTKSDATDSSGTGVFVGKDAQFNKITHNKIYCNDFLGIVLQTVANESIATPTVTAADPNSVSGTGSIDGDIIHVYHNRTPSGVCDCEGETFIGTAVVASGTWTLVHGLNYTLPSAYDVTATETTAANSTSQFSICNAALPVDFISFNVSKAGERSVDIQWSTAWEKNSSHFIVEKSADGKLFEVFTTKVAAGNVQDVSNYFVVDDEPFMGINYYRIRQVDIDGRSTTTNIKSITVDVEGLEIILLSSGVGVFSPENTSATYGVYTELGQEVFSAPIVLNANEYKPLPLNVRPGMYLVYVSTPTKTVWKKVPVRW